MVYSPPGGDETYRRSNLRGRGHRVEPRGRPQGPRPEREPDCAQSHDPGARLDHRPVSRLVRRYDRHSQDHAGDWRESGMTPEEKVLKALDTYREETGKGYRSEERRVGKEC